MQAAAASNPSGGWRAAKQSGTAALKSGDPPAALAWYTRALALLAAPAPLDGDWPAALLARAARAPPDARRALLEDAAALASNRSLALVCILSESVLAQQGLLEYNFSCFRESLYELFST